MTSRSLGRAAPALMRRLPFCLAVAGWCGGGRPPTTPTTPAPRPAAAGRTPASRSRSGPRGRRRVGDRRLRALPGVLGHPGPGRPGPAGQAPERPVRLQGDRRAGRHPARRGQLQGRPHARGGARLGGHRARQRGQPLGRRHRQQRVRPHRHRPAEGPRARPGGRPAKLLATYRYSSPTRRPAAPAATPRRCSWSTTSPT